MRRDIPSIIFTATRCGLSSIQTPGRKRGRLHRCASFALYRMRPFPLKYDEVKAYDAWNVAQSNPCFEIWLYYHFYDIMPVADDVEKHASFKEYVGSIATVSE